MCNNFITWLIPHPHTIKVTLKRTPIWACTQFSMLFRYFSKAVQFWALCFALLSICLAAAQFWYIKEKQQKQHTGTAEAISSATNMKTQLCSARLWACLDSPFLASCLHWTPLCCPRNVCTDATPSYTRARCFTSQSPTVTETPLKGKRSLQCLAIVNTCIINYQ